VSKAKGPLPLAPDYSEEIAEGRAAVREEVQALEALGRRVVEVSTDGIRSVPTNAPSSRPTVFNLKAESHGCLECGHDAKQWHNRETGKCAADACLNEPRNCKPSDLQRGDPNAHDRDCSDYCYHVASEAGGKA
jgi:hypothetical protein